MTRARFQNASRAAAAVIALLAIGLLTVPTGARAGGPASIDSAGTASDRGVPQRLAGRLADSPVEGIAGLAASARGAGDRRGLGLPSYVTLLGRSWQRQAARADRRFAAALSAAPSGPARPGTAVAQRSPVVDLDKLVARDTLRGPAGRQTRELKLATSLSGGCPQLNGLGAGYGWSGIGRATYVVTTTERVGRFDLITSVVFDGSFRTSPEMLPSATASSFSSADSGEISVTRNQVAVDRRSGKRRQVGETERFNSSLDPFYGPDSSFNNFIASQEDGAPAPARRLTSGAWSEATLAFMAVPYDALRSKVLEAERLARTPNACVTVEVEAPTHLAPGQSIDLAGVARPVQAGTASAAVRLAGAVHGTWINPQGQSAVPASSIERVRAGGPWYSFTAPAQRWQEPVGIELELLSGAGIARTPVTFKPEESHLHFEVLDASIETHTTASRPSYYCGEVGGRQTFSGRFAPQPFSPDDQLILDGGTVSGGVEAIVDAEWHDHLVFGCRSGDPGSEPCEATMPNRTPSGDGSWPVVLSFAPAADPSELTVLWRMEDPEVGFVDAGDAECNAYVWGYFPEEERRRTIPRAALQAGGPVTLILAGSGHLDLHAGYEPASIDHQWECKVTLRRVDAVGQPLG
ncbi:MAG: hypothetical protein JWO14_2352 [Solirubrobacterales bacterium]|nr:hypothetical protein [Solirubrobacterales bacterium]